MARPFVEEGAPNLPHQHNNHTTFLERRTRPDALFANQITISAPITTTTATLTNDNMASDDRNNNKMADDTTVNINVADLKAPNENKCDDDTVYKPWYDKHYRLDEEIDTLQRQGVSKFLQWAENAKGPIPDRPNVDDLQVERSKHVEDAPDDEQDDELEVLVRKEAFAQEHHDTMGAVEQYNHPFRHTQTRQYHDSLAEGSDFMLDAKPAPERLMSGAHTEVLPRQDNPAMRTTSAGEARMRMAAALAAFQEANPEMDATTTEADRDRLLGAVEQTVGEVEGNGVGGRVVASEVERGAADEFRGERILICEEMVEMEVDSEGVTFGNPTATHKQKDVVEMGSSDEGMR